MTNLLTKDKQLFVEGMTLYTATATCGDFIISEHKNCVTHGSVVVSSGSQGGSGCFGRHQDMFASRDAAVMSVIEKYLYWCRLYRERADKWKDKLSEPFEKLEGYKAHDEGKKPSDNPYPINSVEHDFWETGFEAALDDYRWGRN